MKIRNKMNRLPVVVCAIAAILIGIGIFRQASYSHSSFIKEYRRPSCDTLSVAIEMSPLTYNLKNDTASGLDYQIIKQIAQIHNKAVVFHPFANFNEAYKELNNGVYDIMVGSLVSTERLKEYFKLSEPVYTDRQVLVQHVDSSLSPVREQHKLIGDTVWIPDGSPYRTRLDNMSRELGDTIVVMSDPEHSSEHLAILTALGQRKFSVTGEAEARKIAEEYGNLDISTPLSLTLFQVWAISPDNPQLLDSINTWLVDYKKTADYQELMSRYLTGH